MSHLGHRTTQIILLYVTPYDTQASSASAFIALIVTALIFTSVVTIITISKIMIKECLQRNPVDDVKNYNAGGRFYTTIF